MLPQTRTLQIWKTVVQVITDFLFLNLGIGIVYLYRFRYFPQLFDSNQRLNASQYFEFNMVFSSLVIVVLALLGVYEVSRKKPKFRQFSNIFIGIFCVIFGLISLFFFFEFDPNIFPNGVPISRFVLLFAGFSSFFAVIVGRIIFYLIELSLQMYGIGVVRIAIIGDKNSQITNYLNNQHNIEDICSYSELNLINLSSLESKIVNGLINEIYIFGSHNSSLMGKLAWYAERYKVNFIFAPEGFGQFEFFDLQPRRINQKLFLEIVHSNLDGWKVVFKRFFDVGFALCFLTVFSPIYVILMLLIWAEDRHSPFYLSDRVGPDGKTFKLWKFRRLKKFFCTNNDNPEALEIEADLIKKQDVRGDGVLYKISNDPRSTRIGQWLEKTSLDEIPQFINVLLGNMSVVGPRPHQPREVAKYQNYHYKVLNIKPGITGMAQISGRSDLKFDQEVELDCWYIENWSFLLDIVIILKTPFAITKGHK